MAMKDNPLFTAKRELKLIYFPLFKGNRFKTVKTGDQGQGRNKEGQKVVTISLLQ
jgi:hypothetical protein